jgi:hypothetical protein
MWFVVIPFSLTWPVPRGGVRGGDGRTGSESDFPRIPPLVEGVEGAEIEEGGGGGGVKDMVDLDRRVDPSDFDLKKARLAGLTGGGGVGEVVVLAVGEVAAAEDDGEEVVEETAATGLFGEVAGVAGVEGGVTIKGVAGVVFDEAAEVDDDDLDGGLSNWE